MAMNLIATADALKNLSDAQLRQSYMAGQVPQFLVLTEMQNRQKIRQAYQGQDPQAAADTTIADKLLQGVGALPTSASISANLMLSNAQGPGSPGADAEVPPGGSNPSATGNLGPGGGTPQKPAAPGGSAQGFKMGSTGGPQKFASGGPVDNEDRGSPPPGSAEPMEPTFDRYGRREGRIWSDDYPEDLIPLTLPSSRYSNAFVLEHGAKRGSTYFNPDAGWNDKKVGIYDLYEPETHMDPARRRRKQMYAEGGRVGYAGGAKVADGLVYSETNPIPYFGYPVVEGIKRLWGAASTKNTNVPDETAGFVLPNGPARLGSFDPSAELPSFRSPPATYPIDPNAMQPGEVIPPSGRVTPLPMPAETEDRQDRVGIAALNTPARSQGRAVGAGGDGGGGGGGGGGSRGGTEVGGGGRAGRPDLAALMPDRFGEADQDVAEQRKSLAEAKGDNVSNALIRMGSAMMEGGAKSGNFLGIAGLGVRSGQEEMERRTTQQDKMRQAILEGSTRVATGRTQRDEGLARGETTMYGADTSAAAHLEAARIAAASHIAGAKISAGAMRNQLLQTAEWLAAKEGVEPSQRHLELASAMLKPQREDPFRDAVYLHAELNGRPGKPIQADYDAAMYRYGGASAETRSDANRLRATELADKSMDKDYPTLKFTDATKYEQIRQQRIRQNLLQVNPAPIGGLADP